MIFVNFKIYQEGTGERALALSKIIEDVATATQIKIIPVVQAMDIREVARSSRCEVWAQGVDAFEYGAHTGAILPEAVLEDGARGTFLNHSENKFAGFAQLEKANQRAKEIGLKTLIFAADLDELKRILSLKPDYVAYEPPELIGSATISVASAEPQIISQAVEMAKGFGTPLVVGAGIHSAQDIRTSLQLGAVGFAVASGIIEAVDQRAALVNLTEGYK
ncbi:MAG: triose-phosphate isomerase [Candidatus Microgenomates bacterium]|jgi:triosephosphate isomerase